MAEKRQLYPLKFNPIPSKRIWGGSDLICKMGKRFTETDENGVEHALTKDDRIGESWEIADMGTEDSVVTNGWLAGNTISEVMETYLERIVGEDCMQRFGTQFPLLIKILDIRDRLSVQVHPDDETSRTRFDSLGKSEIWYVLDAGPDAVIYAGFNRNMTAQELYDRCHDGTIDSCLNVIRPRRGDSLHILPGTVHAATGGLLVAEIQESSDLTFRLYDWGREFDPKTARKTHLDEAIDLVDYSKFDDTVYRKGPLWGAERTPEEPGPVKTLARCPQFTVSRIDVAAPLRISTENSGSFLVYICIGGSAVIQVPVDKAETDADPDAGNTTITKGETVLIPADMPGFMILPTDSGTVLLEATVEPYEEADPYINPDTEPFLEGEDYEGLNDPDNG